jgi:hypothetical protein
VASSCEHGSVSLDSIHGGKFLNWLSDDHFIGQDSVRRDFGLSRRRV